MSFKGELRASLGWNWSDGATDNGRLDYAAQLLSGNGDGQAEAAWHLAGQTLANGESTTLDLTNLTRTILGDLHTVTFLTVKALLVVSHAASVGELALGDAAADTWSAPFGGDSERVFVPPDSPMLLANRRSGWAVDDSNRNLKLAAVGGEVLFSIAVLGTITASGSGSSGSGG